MTILKVFWYALYCAVNGVIVHVIYLSFSTYADCQRRWTVDHTQYHSSLCCNLIHEREAVILISYPYQVLMHVTVLGRMLKFLFPIHAVLIIHCSNNENHNMGHISYCILFNALLISSRKWAHKYILLVAWRGEPLLHGIIDNSCIIKPVNVIHWIWQWCWNIFSYEIKSN